jgi:hypothetical protein
VKPFVSVALFVVLTCVFSPSQTTLSDRDGTEHDTAKLISIVKQTPASQLDSALPSTTFEEWLAKQAGQDSAIGWVVRTGEGHDLPWVEADISVEGHPATVIMIACGKPDSGADAKPRFRSLELVRKNEFAEWSHLHDLPAAMRRAKNEQV